MFMICSYYTTQFQIPKFHLLYFYLHDYSQNQYLRINKKLLIDDIIDIECFTKFLFTLEKVYYSYEHNTIHILKY